MDFGIIIDSIGGTIGGAAGGQEYTVVREVEYEEGERGKRECVQT
jgi:hypothetical protein